MVTISVAEDGNEIKKVLLSAAKGRKVQFGCDIENEELTHVVINEGMECDIAIADMKNPPEIKAGYICIFNSDNELPHFLKESLVISYGLNSLATATASSIREDGERLCFQYCLQRSIISLSGKKIEPQEFPVTVCGGEIQIHTALCIVTLALVCSLDISIFF